MKLTIPSSPVALALLLFGIELCLAVIFTIAGRMTGIDTRVAFLGAVRLYLAAVVLASAYASTRQREMSSTQAHHTSLIYCSVNFVILSALFALHGSSDPTRAIMMVVGALLILTLQYVILWLLLHRVSMIVLGYLCDQQKLPGID